MLSSPSTIIRQRTVPHKFMMILTSKQLLLMLHIHIYVCIYMLDAMDTKHMDNLASDVNHAVVAEGSSSDSTQQTQTVETETAVRI